MAHLLRQAAASPPLTQFQNHFPCSARICRFAVYPHRFCSTANDIRPQWPAVPQRIIVRQKKLLSEKGNRNGNLRRNAWQPLFVTYGYAVFTALQNDAFLQILPNTALRGVRHKGREEAAVARQIIRQNPSISLRRPAPLSGAGRSWEVQKRICFHCPPL